METGSFLFENLPYSILIWLHFGTNILISYSYIFYVFPILFNIVVIVLPHFNFGFMKQSGKGAGDTIIPADLNKTLLDSKVFAHAYSRNPKLFSSLPIQEVGNFFSGLDEKLSGISTALKGFPVAEESKKAEGDINDPTSSPAGSNIASGSSNQDFDDNISEETSTDKKDKKDKKSKKKKDSGKKSSKSSNKSFLLYGNLIFLIAIIGINAYGYFNYNSLFNEFFVAKKGILKHSENNFELDYKKLRTLQDSSKAEILIDLNNYVQIINSVKTEKLRKQKLEEEKEKEKNKK